MRTWENHFCHRKRLERLKKTRGLKLNERRQLRARKNWDRISDLPMVEEDPFPSTKKKRKTPLYVKQRAPKLKPINPKRKLPRPRSSRLCYKGQRPRKKKKTHLAAKKRTR